jgi:hypothetical protein
MEDNLNLLAPASPELGTAQPELVAMFWHVVSSFVKMGKREKKGAKQSKMEQKGN